MYRFPGTLLGDRTANPGKSGTTSLDFPTRLESVLHDRVYGESLLCDNDVQG